MCEDGGALEQPKRTPNEIILGSLYAAGDPSRRFLNLPLSTPVVRTAVEAAIPLARYRVLEVDAAYNYGTRRAGLAWSLDGAPPRTRIRSDVLGPNHAEMMAGDLGLTMATFYGGRYRRFLVQTDNACLANILIGRWQPQKEYIRQVAARLHSLRGRLGGLAVEHVRTREVDAVDRASKRALRRSGTA
jgi:hypothetical protein